MEEKLLSIGYARALVFVGDTCDLGLGPLFGDELRAMARNGQLTPSSLRGIIQKAAEYDEGDRNWGQSRQKEYEFNTTDEGITTVKGLSQDSGRFRFIICQGEDLATAPTPHSATLVQKWAKQRSSLSEGVWPPAWHDYGDLTDPPGLGPVVIIDVPDISGGISTFALTFDDGEPNLSTSERSLMLCELSPTFGDELHQEQRTESRETRKHPRDSPWQYARSMVCHIHRELYEASSARGYADYPTFLTFYGLVRHLKKMDKEERKFHKFEQRHSK